MLSVLLEGGDNFPKIRMDEMGGDLVEDVDYHVRTGVIEQESNTFDGYGKKHL